MAEEQDVRIIMLIFRASEERIRLIDEHTDGLSIWYLYRYHRLLKKNFQHQKQAYFQRIADMVTQSRMMGFGISNKQTFETTSAHAAGAIIGSKFNDLIGRKSRMRKS